MRASNQGAAGGQLGRRIKMQPCYRLRPVVQQKTSPETLPPTAGWLDLRCHPFALIFYTMTNLSNAAATQTELESEVAQLLVSALNLEVAPETIEADADLYGDGLGLDSIDILEIALVVSKQYGIQMKTEGDDNFHIFKSLRSLSAYIAEKRTK